MLYFLEGIALAMEGPMMFTCWINSELCRVDMELMFGLSSCAIMLHTMGMRYMCWSPSYGTQTLKVYKRSSQ